MRGWEGLIVITKDELFDYLILVIVNRWMLTLSSAKFSNFAILLVLTRKEISRPHDFLLLLLSPNNRLLQKLHNWRIISNAIPELNFKLSSGSEDSEK